MKCGLVCPRLKLFIKKWAIVLKNLVHNEFLARVSQALVEYHIIILSSYPSYLHIHPVFILSIYHKCYIYPIFALARICHFFISILSLHFVSVLSSYLSYLYTCCLSLLHIYLIFTLSIPPIFISILSLH